MPPQHLLMMLAFKTTATKTTTTTTTHENSEQPLANYEQSRCPDLQLSDLKGCSQQVLLSALRDVKLEMIGGGDQSSSPKDVIFVAPVSVIRKTLCHRGVKIVLMKPFFPHLSMETPPGFDSFFPPLGEEEKEEEKELEDGRSFDGCRQIRNSRDKTIM